MIDRPALKIGLQVSPGSKVGDRAVLFADVQVGQLVPPLIAQINQAVVLREVRSDLDRKGDLSIHASAGRIFAGKNWCTVCR